MSPLLRIITFCVSIIMSLLRIITIITYYYVFETGQLADVREGLSHVILFSPATQLRRCYGNVVAHWWASLYDEPACNALWNRPPLPTWDTGKAD